MQDHRGGEDGRALTQQGHPAQDDQRAQRQAPAAPLPPTPSGSESSVIDINGKSYTVTIDNNGVRVTGKSAGGDYLARGVHAPN